MLHKHTKNLLWKKKGGGGGETSAQMTRQDFCIRNETRIQNTLPLVVIRHGDGFPLFLLRRQRRRRRQLIRKRGGTRGNLRRRQNTTHRATRKKQNKKKSRVDVVYTYRTQHKGLIAKTIAAYRSEREARQWSRLRSYWISFYNPQMMGWDGTGWITRSLLMPLARLFYYDFNGFLATTKTMAMTLFLKIKSYLLFMRPALLLVLL